MYVFEFLQKVLCEASAWGLARGNIWFRSGWILTRRVAVTAAKGGQVQFRAEKAGLIHAGVGKASFTEQALVENVTAFVSAVSRAKPSGTKGTYIKRVSLSSTMGPGVSVEVASMTSGGAA